jgi:hypothetical protein
MTLSSEVVIESEGWKIKKLFSDGEFTHYVLNYEMENGHSTIPFDEVRASGGLLSLNYEGSRSVTFTEVIDGLNTYVGYKADMPKCIFEELKRIGPY